MIYLQEHNILFLKARKVAGTSFEIALSKFSGPSDIITPITKEDEDTRKRLGFRGGQNYKMSFRDFAQLPREEKIRATIQRRMPYKYYNHISATDTRNKLGARIFDSSFKVSIVRNPFDKLVSDFFWSTRSADHVPRFDTWLLEHPAAINDNYRQYFVNGENVINFYIQYENLEEDIRKLEEIRPELAGLFDTFASLSAKKGVRPKAASVSHFFKDNKLLTDSVRYFNSYHIERFGYDLH